MRKIVIINLIISLIYSCAFTKIESVTDQNYKSKSYSNILILSTFSDLLYKSKVEDACLHYCRSEKITAFSGSELMPPTRDYTTSEINNVLEENEIDGILIVAIQDYWESNYYVPQYASSSSGSATIIGNTISYTQKKQNYGGFSYSKPNVVFESRFFDSRSNEYIWRSTSLTRGNAFANFSTLADSLARGVINKLSEDLIFHEIELYRSSYNKGTLPNKIPEDENSINKEIYNVELLFRGKRYDEAIYKLALLKHAVEQSEFIENKNSLLSKINLIWGACYIEGKGKNQIGKVYIEKALKYNTKLELDRKKYDEEVIRIFEEIVNEPEVAEEEEEEEAKEKQNKNLDKPLVKTYPPGSYVRVVKENAVLILEPTKNSQVIKYLPLGAQLEVLENIENWIKVKLAPNKEGIVIVGFIRVSFVNK